MFFPDLRYVVADSPNWWQAYAFAILTRAVGYENQSLLNAWSRWAGGTQAILLSPTSHHFSAIGIVRDSNTAIVACYGTRNAQQFWDEVYYSQARTSSFVVGRVHGFFLACFLEQHPHILTALADLPNSSNVVFTGHSLGGAIAHILNESAIQNGIGTPGGLVTFGQPRTGDFQFAEHNERNYIRIENHGDVVPDLPPNWLSFPVPLGFNFFPPSRLRYWHGGELWSLTSDGLARRGFWTGNAPLFLNVLNNVHVLPGSPDFLENHYLAEYIRRLKMKADEATGRPDLTALHSLNSSMDALDIIEEQNPNVDTFAYASGGTWDDPNTVITGGPGTVHAPQGDVGRTIETRGVSHSFLQYGRPLIVANTFRGRDRRLLKTLKKVCNDIIARDVRAAEPARTRALSTRQLMFPTGGSPDYGLAIANVIVKATALLAATR